jgi:hypothetical protein
VELLSRVMLVELFLCYDTFTVEARRLSLGSSVTFKSLTKAKGSGGDWRCTQNRGGGGREGEFE